MSRRLAIAAIAMIAFGGVMMPGGFVINDFIQDLTNSSVEEGLLGIKDQGIPIVIESLHEIGPASALEIIAEQGAKASEELVNTTIFMCQNRILAYSHEAFYYYKEAYWDKEEMFGQSFSDLSLSAYGPIKGISEWYGEDLNFTTWLMIDPFLPDIDLWGGVSRLECGVNTTGVRPVSMDALRYLRHFQRSNFEDAALAVICPAIVRELELLMQHYLTYLLEHNLNTPSFLRMVRRDLRGNEAEQDLVLLEGSGGEGGDG